SLCILPEAVHRRQPVLGREVGDPHSVKVRERVIHYDESAGPPPDCGWEGVLDIVGTAHLQGLNLPPQRPSRSFRLPHIEHRVWIGCIPKDRHAGGPGYDLLEELQPFRSELPSKGAQPGDISPRPGEAGHESTSYRVARRSPDDRDRPGGVL